MAGPHAVRDAFESGDRRALLWSMSLVLADDLDSPSTSGRDKIGLTRRLADFAAEIAAIDAAQEGDEVDHAAATAEESFGVVA